MRSLLCEHNLKNHSYQSAAVSRPQEPFRVKLEEAYYGVEDAYKAVR